MTVSSTNNRCAYVGNGSTRMFAVPFLFIADGDVQAVLRQADASERILEQGGDYTLQGAGDAYGGTLTMSVAPTMEETLVIRRNPPMVQEVDYMENGPFPAETHERALDRLTMICQALSERLDRCVSLKVSSAVSGVEMPDPQEGRVIQWTAEGDLANGPVGADIEHAQEYAEEARDSMENARTARDEAVSVVEGKLLPDPSGFSGLEMVRVSADAVRYETRTPAEVRSDIGAVTVVEANLWSKSQRYAETVLAIDAGVVEWDMQAAPRATLTLTEDVTGIVITNPGPGELTIVQDATGGWSVAWPAAILWPGGVAPTVTPDAGAVDVLTFSETGGDLLGMPVLDFKAVA